LYGFKSAKHVALTCSAIPTYITILTYMSITTRTCTRIYIALYIALLYAPAFPLDPSKLFKLLYFDSFWIGESFGYISISILPDSQFGKRPGARDMIILFASIISPMDHYITLYDTI